MGNFNQRGYRNYRGYRRFGGKGYGNNYNNDYGYGRSKGYGNSNSNSNSNNIAQGWHWEKITTELSKFLAEAKVYDRNSASFMQLAGDIFDALPDVNRKFLFEKSVVKIIGFERVDNVIHVKLLVLKSFNRPTQSKPTQPQPQPNSTQTQLL